MRVEDLVESLEWFAHAYAADPRHAWFCLRQRLVGLDVSDVCQSAAGWPDAAPSAWEGCRSLREGLLLPVRVRFEHVLGTNPPGLQCQLHSH